MRLILFALRRPIAVIVALAAVTLGCLPLEAIQSLQALDQSCRECLRAVGDYDEWQFRLHRAMGCPIPQEASPAK